MSTNGEDSGKILPADSEDTVQSVIVQMDLEVEALAGLETRFLAKASASTK
jgi:hypothetical protein